MDVLLNVEPVTSPQNVKGLRHLYDLVDSHVRSLKSLGVTSDSYGSLLSPVLLNKLPPELWLVTREVSEADQSLDSLLKVITTEIEAREHAATHSVQPPQQRGSERTPATATTLVTGTIPTAPSCCYCQQAHTSTKCPTVTSVDAQKILKRNGRCFSCLKRGHMSMSHDCRSSSKCHKCSGRHHVSICTRIVQDSARHSSTNVAGGASPPQPRNDGMIATSSGLNLPNIGM